VKIANAIFMPNSEEPSSYRETFALLAREVYIDCTLMEKMSGLVFYRNLLAHEYYDVSEKDLLDLQANIWDVPTIPGDQVLFPCSLEELVLFHGRPGTGVYSRCLDVNLDPFPGRMVIMRFMKVP